MNSKKSEKRKKKKKARKPRRIARERRPAGLPGMFPSPIMGSNSVVYQPAPMPREDPVAQINIRNTEAVRNRLLLEQVTDLVAPQRKPETLALSNPPIVASSTPKESLDNIPPYRDKPPPPPKRSSSAPIKLRLGKAEDYIPTAGVGTKQKVSEVKTGLESIEEKQQRARRTKKEIAEGMTHDEKVALVAKQREQAALADRQAAEQAALANKPRGRSLTRKGI